jgi:hypothetical protein
MHTQLPKNVIRQVTDTYVTIIKEYFTLMSESEIMIELNHPVSSLYIGINAIHRVFEYILIKTKSIDKTYYYSKKSYFYYLEYIEQIYSSNLVNNLNHMDAILFVYKKTIFDLYDGEQNNTSNTLSNIMTMSDITIAFNEKDMRALSMKITKGVNVLFNWENSNISFNDRLNISKNYLARFLNNIINNGITTEYLEFIQKKIEMNYTMYESLLKEILEKIEKKRTKLDNVINIENQNENFLIKFYLEESIFKEKIEKGNMKEFVKWLYQPIC